MKHVCNICGWEYDEALGAPEHGIEPGTKFEDLPDDFHCALCGVGKESFVEAYQKADELRGEYDVTLLEKAKKVGKQLARLEERGFAFYYNKERSEELQILGE